MTDVLGLDLSLTGTGWAWVDNYQTDESIETGTFTTKASTPMEQRLAAITGSILGLEVGSCHLIVVEDFVTGSPSASKLGMVHGAVRVGLHQDGPYPVLLVPPATLKVYATGKGNATKADMRMALYQRTGIDESDDNRVDALFLAYLGHAVLGGPLLDLPKTHTRALDKLDLGGLKP